MVHGSPGAEYSFKPCESQHPNEANPANPIACIPNQFYRYRLRRLLWWGAGCRSGIPTATADCQNGRPHQSEESICWNLPSLSSSRFPQFRRYFTSAPSTGHNRCLPQHHPTTIMLFISLLSVALAAPTKRSLSANDVAVVQLANYLENLEFGLYTLGATKYSDAEYMQAGFPSGYREEVQLIADQESIHAVTLAGILSSNGMSGVPGCQYMFPFGTPQQFGQLANMITTVGIGAYLGGAMLLMDDPSLLTSATSILTIEARHDSYLRNSQAMSPFPSPFDTPLPAQFAYSLAQQFVTSCPMQLSFTPLPLLTTKSNANGAAQFTTPSSFSAPSGELYVAWVSTAVDPVYVTASSCGGGCFEASTPSIGGVGFPVLTTLASGSLDMLMTQGLALGEVIFS